MRCLKTCAQSWCPTETFYSALFVFVTWRWRSSRRNWSAPLPDATDQLPLYKVVEHVHGCRKDFNAGATRRFSQKFSGGGQNWWNLFFLPLETKRTTFFAKNFKIQGGKVPPAPPLSTPMSTSALWSYAFSVAYVLCGLANFSLVLQYIVWHCFFQCVSCFAFVKPHFRFYV